MIVKVRYNCGAYVASCEGKRASCTMTAERAACNAAAKAFRVPNDQVKVIRDDKHSTRECEIFLASKVG
jgi:hypothetical protein